jgi:hypothetical protein
MDMSEVEDMDMVEEQDHLTNHRLGEKDMNMVDSNMEVDGMDMVEYFHPMNHRTGGEGYRYSGGAFSPDEPPTEGGGYGYGGYWYEGG